MSKMLWGLYYAGGLRYFTSRFSGRGWQLAFIKYFLVGNKEQSEQ
jgi:hypothetical protein